MRLLTDIKRQLRQQARRMDHLASQIPAAEDLLTRYRADPALLMTDAGLPPDEWQQRLLRSDSRRILMLTCRQAGKSTLAGFLALREALFTAGTTALVVCPSQRQSAELVRRVRDAVNRLNGVVRLDGESVLQVRFSNGSRVIALPASESGIRGYTSGLVILDEAARIPDALVAAVRPMLGTTGGKLVCLSTAFARSGWFYDAWQSKEPWDRVRVAADRNPRLTAEFLAEEKRTLGARWYAMEYLCEFQDDVASLFSMEDIERAISPDVKPLFGPPADVPIGVTSPAVMPLFEGSSMLRGGLEWQCLMREAEPRRPEPEPELPANAIFAGLDLGQASDFSALAVVERWYEKDPTKPGKTIKRFDVRHLHRWPLKTPYPNIVTEVKGMFADGQPLAKGTLVVDATGVGRAVVDMFRQAQINGTMRPFTITAGEAVTGNTVAKKHLVGAVQAPLSSGRLRFAEGMELTQVLVEELMAFRVKVTVDRNETFESWRERDHDDLVLGLALALFVADVPDYCASFANVG